MLHIGFVLYGGLFWLAPQAHHFDIPDEMLTAMNGAMILGVIFFLIALTQYDLGRFAGVTQLFTPPKQDQEEPLHLGGLHRYVRHPLYTGGYLYLWGSVRTEFDLATALLASLYLMIGTHFEEQKLIAIYGEAYRDYQQAVPAILPWRGKAL